MKYKIKQISSIKYVLTNTDHYDEQYTESTEVIVSQITQNIADVYQDLQQILRDLTYDYRAYQIDRVNNDTLILKFDFHVNCLDSIIQNYAYKWA